MTSQEILSTIVAQRKALNMSEAELARQTGLERRYVGRMLKGTHSPTLDVLIRLCAAVGLGIEIVNKTTNKVE